VSKLFLVLLVVAVVVLICALPTMWMWNWLMPELFHLREITFGEALGVQMLSALLFKSHSTSSKS
jgi:hypothetical protein